MRVRLKKSTPRYGDLTVGNVYRVIGIEADYYRIMNDDGRPYLYPPHLFTLVDRRRPADWHVAHGDDGELYAYPPELERPGFFEDYFDYKRSAMATLELHLRRQRETDLPPVARKRRSAG